MKRDTFACLFFLLVFFAGLEAFCAENPVEEMTADDGELSLAQTIYANHDGRLAFQTFSKLAHKGNPAALAWLGRCHLEGVGTEQRPAEAFRCFKQAAAMQDPMGINGLGECYQKGIATAQNIQEARRCFEKAAAMGEPLAVLNLARLFCTPECHDAKSAEEYFHRAMELAPIAATAAIEYADMLLAAGMYEEAFPILNKHKDQVAALRNLVRCYDNGWGTEMDRVSAVSLAETLAKRNPADSALAGEVLYDAALEEWLFAGNSQQCVDMLRKAALCGNREAQLEYGMLLERHNKTAEALSYLRKSADQGCPRALLQAGLCAADQNRIDVALDYLLRAAEYRAFAIAAIDKIAALYMYKLQETGLAYVWALRGTELSSDECRVILADIELGKQGEAEICHAFMQLELAAWDKNQTALQWQQNQLGKYYDLLRVAADRGNRHALCGLGLYGIQQGAEHPSFQIGFELLERAVAAESADACRILGNAYLSGLIGHADVHKAMEYYQKGAKLGDSWCAMQVLCMYYARAEFHKVPYAEMDKWGKLAMALGSSAAYEYGLLAESFGKDSAAALELFQRAARRHDARALNHLHDMHMQKDSQKADEYLQASVSLGDADAEIGVAYAQVMIHECSRKAFGYYVRAFKHGNLTTAPCLLGEMAVRGEGCTANVPKGLELLLVAYDNGNDLCCYCLGKIHEEGRHVARNLDRARAYYEEGVKRGNKRCAEALKDLAKVK